MEVKLLPHNEEGYCDLVNCLEKNQFVSMNRATGTGKSFILLKYMYENRDKRILFLAPTYPILEQLKINHMKELGISVDDFTKFDTMIYRNLLVTDIEKLVSSYDIIIVDEYHRCGSLKIGKKIRTMKDILYRKFPDKKMIGTTATEIRYLDNERDMSKILFDGVEAGRLSLKDAILRGILPAPVYINCDLSILDDIEKIKKRVDRYLLSGSLKDEVLGKLDSFKKSFLNFVYNSDDNRKYIIPGEKYLVFSSEIKKIDSDKELIDNFFSGIDRDEFVIHSGKSRDKNLEILRNFRELDGKTSILYSIDILNEGVHVKNVFAEFMCRRTVSPIIYFQQLGRLLSYSKRKEQVVVIDVVGNIRNHKAIYSLYEDVVSGASELMISDPLNRDRYLEIVNRFKIVDKTSQMYDQINEMNKEFSIDNLIKLRLDSSISLLENKNKYSYLEVYCSCVELHKYYKYITLEQFRRIKKLDIVKKPKLINMSEEDFISLLNGFSNLHEFSFSTSKISFNAVKGFIQSKCFVPSLFGDEEELSYAKNLYLNFENYGDSYRKYIYSSIQEDLSLFEKICYGEEVSIDFNELLEQVQYVIGLGLPISSCVLEVFKDDYKALYADFEKYNYEILLKKIDLKEKNIDYIDDNSFYGRSYDIVIDVINKRVNEFGLEKVVDDSYKEITFFIHENNRGPMYKSLMYGYSNDDLMECLLYYELLIFEPLFVQKGFMDKINDLIIDIKIKNSELNESSILNKVFDFFYLNGGFPSSKNPDFFEKQLANLFSRINKNLTSVGKDFFEQKKSDIQRYKYKFINEYVEFIKSNNRYPLVTVDSEKNLVYGFNRWEPYFTKSDKDRLKISNSKFDMMKNSYKKFKGSV